MGTTLFPGIQIRPDRRLVTVLTELTEFILNTNENIHKYCYVTKVFQRGQRKCVEWNRQIRGGIKRRRSRRRRSKRRRRKREKKKV